MHWFIPGLVLLVHLFASAGFAEDANSTSGTENMALIAGGVYEMGSRKSLKELDPADLMNTDRHALGPENPAHHVHVDGFYMDIYEVTNAEYKKFVSAEGEKEPRFFSDPKFNDPKQPVVGVSWKKAVQYCAWKGKRLPTEAEWEKASRGKRHIAYPWGNEPPDSKKVNFNEEVKKTSPVGSYPAGKSDYGVYDLSGNVSEWTNDWHLPEYYLFSPKKNPQGFERGQYKVIRGGNWRNDAFNVNMTYRNATTPSMKNNTVGFRCVKSAEGE